MTTAYPLSWPPQRSRNKRPTRASFNKKVTKPGKSYAETTALSVADAVERLQRELDLLRATNYVLSSNVEPRLDGRPRSGQAEPPDAGVALYFHLNGKPHCLPCDRYDRVADNIAAIAKHIEATRAIERWGVASLSEMFTGFQSLPPPGNRDWRDVLGLRNIPVINISSATIENYYRKLARERHPDAGGSDAMMAELNAARDAGLKAVKPVKA